MKTRKALENGDENPSKRQRVLGGSRMPADTAVSFSSLPSDCKVHAFSFLPAEDMNSAACCNKDCFEVRANESLDQQRTGTLVWTANTTKLSFCNKLVEVQARFTGNRTRLNIVDHEDNSEPGGPRFRLLDIQRLLDGVRLEEVTSLCCSSNTSLEKGLYILLASSMILPNLVEMDLSNIFPMRIADIVLHEFSRRCPALTKITWNNGCQNMFQCGQPLSEATNLTQLYVDNIEFSWLVVDEELTEEQVRPASTRPDYYLLMKCRRLERLSIKGATVFWLERNNPLSQEALIQMVRHHPTLRWLRSDLTAENVAMLKQERPEITFVSE